MTIDELNPIKNQLDSDNLSKFLSEFDHTYFDRTKPKGPDYLIIDSFLETFESLEKADLINARSEAEEISNLVCDLREDYNSVRCDNL